MRNNSTDLPQCPSGAAWRYAPEVDADDAPCVAAGAAGAPAAAVPGEKWQLHRCR